MTTAITGRAPSTDRYQPDRATYGVISLDAWCAGMGPSAAIAWFSTEKGARESMEHLTDRERREWCYEPARTVYGRFAWVNSQPR